MIKNNQKTTHRRTKCVEVYLQSNGKSSLFYQGCRSSRTLCVACRSTTDDEDGWEDAGSTRQSQKTESACWQRRVLQLWSLPWSSAHWSGQTCGRRVGRAWAGRSTSMDSCHLFCDIHQITWRRSKLSLASNQHQRCSQRCSGLACAGLILCRVR